MSENIYNKQKEIAVSSTLKVFNQNHNQDSFYQMSSIFQVTIEYCSGISDNDYINIVTLSPTDSSLSTFNTKTYLSYLNSRSLHHHDYYEILFVLEGEVIHKIEDKEYHYKAGSCCLINPSIRHGEIFINQCKLLFIGLSPELLSQLFSNSSLFESSYTLTATIDDTLFHFFSLSTKTFGKKEYLDIFPVFQNNANINTLHNIANHLLAELITPHFGSIYTCIGLICSFIEHLSIKSNFHISHIELNSNPDYLLFLRISHLLKDTNGRLSRNDLSTFFNYSGNYINKIIKKYSGLCLYDYGIFFCMEEAKTMLTNTDLSIIQIMETLGFTNSTHFYELFKKQYGQTPGEYRKRQKETSRRH